MSQALTAQSREKEALTERRNLLTEFGMAVRATQAAVVLLMVAVALGRPGPITVPVAALVVGLSRYLPVVLWRYGRAKADLTGLACSLPRLTAQRNVLRYHLARVNAADLERMAPTIAARIGRSTWSVAPRSRSRATLTLHRADPLAREISPPRRSNGQRVTIGLSEDGTPLLWDRTPLLIGGAPGQGKSYLLASLVEQVAVAEPDAAMVLVDLKQVSLLAQASLFVEVATDYAHALDVLEHAVALLRDRYAAMVAQGVDEFRGPRIYIFCDELAELINSGDKKRDERALALLRSLARLGRQGGMVLVAASQVLSVDVIDSSLRNLFLSRVAFALPSPEAMRSALGTAGDPSLCTAPGVGLALLPGNPQPVRFKGLVPRRRVSRAAPTRPAPAVRLRAEVAVDPAQMVSHRLPEDARPAPPSRHGSDAARCLAGLTEPATVRNLAAAIGLSEGRTRAALTALVTSGAVTRTAAGLYGRSDRGSGRNASGAGATEGARAHR